MPNILEEDVFQPAKEEIQAEVEKKVEVKVKNTMKKVYIGVAIGIALFVGLQIFLVIGSNNQVNQVLNAMEIQNKFYGNIKTTKLNPAYGIELFKKIEFYAGQYNLDKYIILAVVDYFGFNRNNLMQISPELSGYSKNDLANADKNFSEGCKILSNLLKGNKLSVALEKYSGYNKNTDQKFAQKVIMLYNNYSK